MYRSKNLFFFSSLLYIANEHTRPFDPFFLLLFFFFLFYSLDTTIAPSPSLLKKCIFPPLQTLFVLLFFFLLSFAPYFVSLYMYIYLFIYYCMYMLNSMPAFYIERGAVNGPIEGFIFDQEAQLCYWLACVSVAVEAVCGVQVDAPTQLKSTSFLSFSYLQWRWRLKKKHTHAAREAASSWDRYRHLNNRHPPTHTHTVWMGWEEEGGGGHMSMCYCFRCVFMWSSKTEHDDLRYGRTLWLVSVWVCAPKTEEQDTHTGGGGVGQLQLQQIQLQITICVKSSKRGLEEYALVTEIL